jgi:hypothetical protein
VNAARRARDERKGQEVPVIIVSGTFMGWFFGNYVF